MRRDRAGRKKRGIVKAGAVVGAMLVFMNVNAAPMSVQDSPIKTGHLDSQTSVSGANVTNGYTKANSLTNFGYEQVAAALDDKIAEQNQEIILNGTAAEAIQACQRFYTAADFESLQLPKVQALAGAELRVSAEDGAAVIHTFDGNESVTMLYQCEDSNFYYVEYNGMYRGYVACEGLDVSILSAAQLAQVSEVNHRRFSAIASQETYLWTQPSEEGEVAAVVESGVMMEIIGKQDGYLWVKVAGSTGFVRGDEVIAERTLTAEVDDEGYIKSVRAEMELQEQMEAAEAAEAEAEEAAGEEAEEEISEEGEEPSYDEPSYDEPSYDEPSYDEPSYDEPSYEEPEVPSQGSGSSIASQVGAAIANTALSYLGVPYVYGGASPSGFDCSGLVYYCAMLNGVSVPRCADDQYYANGTHVSFSELAMGDLVFFSADWSSEIEHVGIYIGGGQFVHAPHTGDVVKISSLTDYYARNYWGALRLN